MRFHQSWWRAHRLGVRYGVGPTVAVVPLGNYLQVPDAEAGLNFLSPDIFEVVLERLESEGALERYRLLANLLSSQPMCFNLFGPLVRDRALAADLFDVVVPEGVSEVLSVRVEYAPVPRSEFLDDGTAFDAFVHYLDRSGVERFVGVETKLTEPFSPQAYRRNHRPQYETLTAAVDSPWHDTVGDAVCDRRWNQLWRNQLLVEATRKHPSAPHGALGSLMVVHHPGDTRCAEVISQYRELLSDPDRSLMDVPLDALVERLAPLVTGAHADWLAAFRDRYLDLGSSQPFWEQQ